MGGMTELDLTREDLAQNRVIDRLNQRIDTLEKQLAPLGPLAATVGKHEALLNAINVQVNSVIESVSHAHDLLQQITDGPLEVLKVVKNFVDELMVRVGKVEQALAPVRDALNWLQARTPPSQNT